MPKEPHNSKTLLDDIPRTTNDQERKYLSPDNEARFLWLEKDSPAEQLGEEQCDSQSTGAKENKGFFNKISEPEDVSSRGHRASTLKNSTIQAIFENFTQDSDDSNSRKIANLVSLNSITFSDGSDSLINRAHYRLQTIIHGYYRIRKITRDGHNILFWNPNERKAFSIFRVLPLSTFATMLIASSNRIFQEGIG